MKTIPWFERQFEFSFPLETLPNVCARLRGTAARLDEELHEIERELLVAKPAGGWSAQEHAGHLADMEPLWLTRVEDFVAGREKMTPADLQNRKTHEAAHNDRALASILADFREDREELARRADGLDAATVARTLPHPRMGTPMRLIDHLFFVAEHDDHHLARIHDLLRRSSIRAGSDGARKAPGALR